MPVIDIRNVPTVVEFAPENKVVEFTEDTVTAEVVVGPTVVEFSWGELIPEPGLSGGGVFEGRVYIRPDIPTLPTNSEPVDPTEDYIMLWDASSDTHVKVLAALGGGGGGGDEIEWATHAEVNAGAPRYKAVDPETGAYAYDRLRHVGQHAAGKGTQTVVLTPDTGVVTVNGALSNVFYLTLTSDVEFANPINPINGQTVNIHLKQNIEGGWNVTEWGSQWKFVNKINPELSSDPNAIDLLSCQWNEIDGIMECSFLPDYGSGFIDPPPPTAADLTFVNVGGANNIYRNRDGLNVNFRTLAAEGDITVRTEGDQIIYSYTAPVAVDYSAVPFLIVGDPAEYPSLLYARQIVAGTGIAIDTLTEGAFTISSDLVPIPPGGTTAQVLSKLSDDEYDVAWVDPPEGGGAALPAGGTTGQALVKLSAADSDVGWGTIEGGGGGTVNTSHGALSYIGTTVLGSAATSITSPTLNLDADSIYYFELTALNALGSAPTVAFSFNADTTAANYSRVRAVNDSSASSTRANDNGLHSLSANDAWGLRGYISRGSDGKVRMNYTGDRGDNSADVTTASGIVVWATTATNVTSFTVTGSTASCFAAGATVKVWKLGVAGLQSGAIVARSSSLQTITPAGALISFDTEVLDTENYWAISPNPTQIVIPASGWYTVTATVIQSVDPDDVQTVAILKNGAAYNTNQHQTRVGISASIATSSQVIDTDYYAAGDYLEVWVNNRTGNSTCYCRASIIRHSGPTGPQGVQGPVGGAAESQLRVQEADVSYINNTTLANTDLVSGTLQPGMYAFDCFIAYSPHATPDLKLHLNFTGMATDVRWQITNCNVGGASSVGAADAFNVAAVLSSITTVSSGVIQGTFTVTAAGVLSLAAAQITSSATASVFEKGSWLRITDLTNVNPTTIDDEIAADSPRGYWKLDEAGGNFADSSGNGYTLTLTNSPVDAYQFAAADSNFPTRKTAASISGGKFNYAGNSSALGLTLPITTYTMEAWGKFTASGVLMAIGADGETLATNYAGQLLITAAGGLNNFFEYGAGTNSGVGASILGGGLDGKLHHFVIVKDAAALTVKYYIDGIYAGGGTYTSGQEHTGGTSGVFSIMGSPGDSTAAPDGLYSGAAFYTTALSEARIQAHARALGLF